MEKTIHHGHNIERFRKLLDIKQETLASLLGEDWTQKKVSLLEDKEVIDDDLLKQVADALKITPGAIKNFSEESAVHIIANSFTSNDSSTLHGINYQPTFNPIDKVVELLEKMVREKDELIAKLSKKK